MTENQRAQFFAMRKSMDKFVEKIVDSATEINENMAAIRPWMPGVYVPGDVRMYEGTPYKCVQAHDCTNIASWTPTEASALWAQYHGTSKETARAYVAPTGAHDMYKVNEYMVWVDGTVYRCVVDTVYSPVDYAQAWAKVE